MPTYEYHCDACEHHFDEFQSITEKPLKKCPQCGKRKLRRIFGIGAAIIFKGSGFYQTDYRSESYKAAAKADQESAKPAEAAKSGQESSPPAAADKSSANGTAGTAAKETSVEGSKAKGKKPKSAT